MAGERNTGAFFLKLDGVLQSAQGSFSYNLGRDKKESTKNHDGTVTRKVIRQIAYMEGVITDSRNLDLAAFAELEGVTVTMELANGKTVVFHDADQCGDGTANTEDGTIACRFECEFGEELK